MIDSREFLLGEVLSKTLNILLVSMVIFLVLIPNPGAWTSNPSALFVPACFWLGTIVLVALLDVGIGRILATKRKSPSLASTSLMTGLDLPHAGSKQVPYPVLLEACRPRMPGRTGRTTRRRKRVWLRRSASRAITASTPTLAGSGSMPRRLRRPPQCWWNGFGHPGSGPAASVSPSAN